MKVRRNSEHSASVFNNHMMPFFPSLLVVLHLLMMIVFLLLAIELHNSVGFLELLLPHPGQEGDILLWDS